MKFAADLTVGKLAKWLRSLGYDTVFLNEVNKDALLALADQGRVLLSRNRNLVGKIPKNQFVLLHHNDPKEQVREVLRTLNLTLQPENFFSRCITCNRLLEKIDRQAVFGKVPDHVWTAHKWFSTCYTCDKLYWSGSHVDQCRDEMERLFDEKDIATKHARKADTRTS
jgi:uncharacterized protein with PIN domain